MPLSSTPIKVCWWVQALNLIVTDRDILGSGGLLTDKHASEQAGCETL